ncbi:MAG: hypothetical protein GXC94_07480 [Comamonadaceae bacterium]|nr:hypothetical protein [Comamonadaceae bacterium]
MHPAATALLSILGVIVGAALQWWFARRGNEHKQLLELRSKAYADFFESTAQLVSARRLGKTEHEAELLGKLTDAKARICIYGEEAVILELAEFWSAGASFETESGILSFTRFCMNVRRSLGMPSQPSLGSEVSSLLFGVVPKGRK